MAGPVEPLQISTNRWQRTASNGGRSQSLSEEEAAQRTLLSLLNKLTPEKWDRLIPQFLTVTVTRASTLKAIVARIFNKAVMERAFADMYSELCQQLANSMPAVHEEGDTKPLSFQQLLLERSS